MMKKEFEQLIGKEVSVDTFEKYEAMYTALPDSVDKRAFVNMLNVDAIPTIEPKTKTKEQQPNKYEVLELALIKAIGAANAAKSDDDGGTCNFDSPTINHRQMGMTPKKVIEVLKNIGLDGWKYNSRYGGGYIVVEGCTCGQGNCRTDMAKAFHKSLVASGISSGMYYQMD